MKADKSQVLHHILKLVATKERHIVHKTLDAFSGQLGKSTVYNYLRELSDRRAIAKVGTDYELVRTERVFVYENDVKLSEDRLCRQDFEPLLTGYVKNVVSIWRYAFLEMLNNAIEHSAATSIRVTVSTDCLNTTVRISDNGIGIFEHICRHMRDERGEDYTLQECAGLLFSGKFTTARELHSGEGIFFTSHVMDSFVIYSDGVVFTRDNFSEEHAAYDRTTTEGTVVVMSLHNKSNTILREVFDRFSDADAGFNKTHIPIARIFAGSGPVSRSEARRLGEMIARFTDVTLDFRGVDEVGQSFVHELFIVWQRRYPDISLHVVNACDDVAFMIRRGKHTQ